MCCTNLRASHDELGATAPIAVPCRKNFVRNSHQSGRRRLPGAMGCVVMTCVLLLTVYVSGGMASIPGATCRVRGEFGSQPLPRPLPEAERGRKATPPPAPSPARRGGERPSAPPLLAGEGAGGRGRSCNLARRTEHESFAVPRRWSLILR